MIFRITGYNIKFEAFVLKLLIYNLIRSLKKSKIVPYWDFILIRGIRISEESLPFSFFAYEDYKARILPLNVMDIVNKRGMWSALGKQMEFQRNSVIDKI